MKKSPVVEHDHHTATKVVNWISFAAIAFILFVIGVFVYWATANDTVIEVKEVPIPIRTIREHPSAGGVVFLDVNFCKYKDIEGKLRMSFISETREIFLPLTRERGEKICRDIEFPVAIPKDIPADTYRVKFRVEYKLNPIKTVHNEFLSKEFTVE